jgi:hypothetical protein
MDCTPNDSIYKRDGSTLILGRTGTHSDLGLE